MERSSVYFYHIPQGKPKPHLASPKIHRQRRVAGRQGEINILKALHVVLGL
jgi:hypothetical protein